MQRLFFHLHRMLVSADSSCGGSFATSQIPPIIFSIWYLLLVMHNPFHYPPPYFNISALLIAETEREISTSRQQTCQSTQWNSDVEVKLMKLSEVLSVIPS